MQLAPQPSQVRRPDLLVNESTMSMRKKDPSSRSVIGMQNEADAQKNKPKVLYENTYRLEPQRKFEAHKVKALMREVLMHHLQDEKYEPKACSQMAQTLTQIIMGKVKELNYERYKVVCLVTIGELKEQGMRAASQCVWDAKWDTFASENFKNKSLFAIANVFAAYQE